MKTTPEAFLRRHDMFYEQMPFAELAAGLEETGLAIGVQIKCQKEEIFDKMHRI